MKKKQDGCTNMHLVYLIFTLVCKEGFGTIQSFTGKPISNGYYGANMLAFGRLMKKKDMHL